MVQCVALVNAHVLQPGATFPPTQDSIADPIGDGPRRAIDRRIAPAILDAMFNATGKRVTDMAITRGRVVWR
jgi:xanthine dehydrogenase YagR molybdenum-binding subunit